METTQGRFASPNRGRRLLRSALVFSFVACLSAGSAVHAINFNVTPNGNCTGGGVGISGEITASFDLIECKAEIDGSICSEKDGDPVGCCDAGTCSPTIDRVTYYNDSPTLGCTANGLPIVLCEGPSCDNPAVVNALLGPEMWIALYAGGSIKVEWSGTGSGTSWGSVQATEDKEPPTCTPVVAPTLSEWAMIVMIGLLALGGIGVLRSRMARTD